MTLTEYEKLLAQVNKLNLVTGEKCLICHFPDKKENLIQLKCNHYFHLNCLACKTNTIKCPYCNRSSSFKDYSKNKEVKKCQVILKNGKNKGKVCGRTNCKYHKIPEIAVGCDAILKSGPRKGEKCNRINCKYHVKTIIV